VILEPILIGVFAFVATPVTYMLLVRAAVGRDRARRGKEDGADREAGADDSTGNPA
jgi:multisubunit Na+/H+ antiporter MnhG subunit